MLSLKIARMAQLAAQLHHMEKDKCSSHFTSTSTVAGLRVVVVRFQPTVSEPLFVLGGVKYINQNGRVERALNTIM